MGKKDIRVRAVLESDLDQLLESLGLLDELEAGRLKCFICGQVVSKDNLGSIFPYAGEIRVCCDKTECYMERARLLKGRQSG